MITAKEATHKGAVKEGTATNDVVYVNDRPYGIIQGETILEFLRRHNGHNAVPTLCDAPNLEAFGSCRVCSVDVALEAGGFSSFSGGLTLKYKHKIECYSIFN